MKQTEPVPPAPVALHSPAELQPTLAARLREVRLRLGWKQSTLASRSGVSLPTIHRFERSGQITLANWLRLCQALGVLDQVAELFPPPSVLATSMAALERSTAPAPQRGRR